MVIYYQTIGIITMSYHIPNNQAQSESINAQDPRYAEIVYKANHKNVKVGKAKSLKDRMDNYFKTFGEENVNFHPIIITEKIKEAEKTVMKELDSYRVRIPVSHRKTEWLLGITRDEAIEIVVKNIYKSNINYSLAKGITIEVIS